MLIMFAILVTRGHDCKSLCKHEKLCQNSRFCNKYQLMPRKFKF